MQKVVRKQVTKRQKALTTPLAIQINEGKDKGAICPFCQSRRLMRRGRSKSKNFIKQRYFCLNCNKSTVNPLVVDC